MADLMANVLADVDRILGPSESRQIGVRVKCENPACFGGHVDVDAGMRWQKQICPECLGSGTIQLKGMTKK